MSTTKPRSAQVIALPGLSPDRLPAEPPAPSEADEAAARESAERAQRRRVLWIRESKVIATSYAINGVCLGLFALTGTVHWSAALLYAVPGWIVCAIACALISNGYSQRWSDPSMSAAQSIAGMVICGLGIAVFPVMTFLYVLILFTIFLSATYRMPRSQATLAWFIVSAVIGAATLTGSRSLQIPSNTAAEQFTAWACFTATLARCVLLSIINSGHNQLLRQRGEQMAATLAQIERLANYDELTGLLNRRSILRVLDEEIDRAERDQTPLTVALLDIDHFKAVNDQHGHLTGDRTLQTFAEAVQAHQRATDRFGRHGGEEFLLILPDTGAAEAELALERLRDGVAGADWASLAPGLSVSFSAGLAVHQAGEPVEQLLSRADRGLYGAKDAGRNCHRAG
jgi:diguanylate cyclase (GGDEF)-like protein